MFDANSDTRLAPTASVNVTSTDSSVEQLGRRDFLSLLMTLSLGFRPYFGFVALTICLVGSILNFINLTVLLEKRMRQSAVNCLLAHAALADMLTMMFYCPVLIVFYCLPETTSDNCITCLASTNIAFVQYHLFYADLGIMLHSISIWVVVSIGVFRYAFMRSCHRELPLKPRHANATLMLIVIAVVALSVPNLLVNGIQCDALPANVTGSEHSTALPLCRVDVSDLALSSTHLMNVNFWFNFVIIKTLPCVCLTVVTVLLFRVLVKARQKNLSVHRAHISAGLPSESCFDDTDDRRTPSKETPSRVYANRFRNTKMLLVISGVFVLIELPHGILFVCNILIDWFYRSVYEPLGDFLDLIVLMHTAMNFIIFYKMSSKFRKTFHKIYFFYPFCRYQ